MATEDYDSLNANTVTLRIPYLLVRKDLVIDQATHHSTHEILHALEWMIENRTQPSVLERVMRSTVLLHDARAGNFSQCLATAIIWEVG